MKKKIICIVGPTASGKTKLAVELAKKISAQGGPAYGWNGAEIISADSRQVYKGLDVGTGKDLKEYGKIKYYLINICEPEQRFTMFNWLKLARNKIKEIHERGKVPIVVGGTGLYVQALVEGFELSQKLKINPPAGGQNDNIKIKKYSRLELEKKSPKQLRTIYTKLPAPNIKLDIDNPRRLIRAIEKYQSELVPTKVKPDFETLQIGIDLPRKKLYENIDRRVDERFQKQKMLEEVEGLLDSGVDINWLTGLGLEYRIISDYINKILNIKNQNDKEKIKNLYQKVKNKKEFRVMEQKLKYKTHAFARRQLTWFRRFPEIKWIKNQKQAERLVKKFLEN